MHVKNIIMRTYEDIKQMADGDYAIGLEAHYKPLANLIKESGYKNIIEIGTAYAGNAYHLLSNVEIDKLTCIDPYVFYPAMPGFTCQKEYDTLFEFATNRLKPWSHAHILKTTSLHARPYFSFADLVFLDGNHDYSDVISECESYSQIIRAGGVLSGHDYNIFEGVNQAVDEFSYQLNKKVNLLPGNIWYFNF
jgi:hypothetical protein